MLGGYISDLEKGDVFSSVTYTLTALSVTEYAHGVEEDCEWFLSDNSPWGRQVRPPTMIHSDKMRVLEVNCPSEARVSGHDHKDARIHYEYHAKHHSPAFVGEQIVVSGQIEDRIWKRGREYLHYALEVRTSDGRLVTEYRDRTLLRYRPKDNA
jgi:N-terminal half of MaoC dehydratase